MLYHGLPVSRSDLLELFYIVGLQIAVCLPACQLIIVIFHTDGRKALACCQHSVISHNVATGNSYIFYRDVVLITEVLLYPVGPVVVLYIRASVSGRTTIVYGDLQSNIVCERLPSVNTCYCCGCSCICACCRTLCYRFLCSGICGCVVRAAAASGQSAHCHSTNKCCCHYLVKSILLHKSILLVFPKEKSESLARRGFSSLKIIHSFMCTPSFGEN